MVSTEIAAEATPGAPGATSAAMVSVEIAGSAAVGVADPVREAAGPGAAGADAVRPGARIRPLLAAAVACLGLAALLVSGKLVEIAERQPLGESRDWWLSLATGVDRTANFLSLNRPYDLILEARGVGADAGQQVESIAAVAAAAGIDPDSLVVGGAGGGDGQEDEGAVGSVQDPVSPPADPGPDLDPSDPSPPAAAGSSPDPTTPPDRPVTDPAADPDGGDPPVADPSGLDGADELPVDNPSGADPEDGGQPVAAEPGGGDQSVAAEPGDDGQSVAVDPGDDGQSVAADPRGGDPPVVGPPGVDPVVTDPSGPGSTGVGSPGSETPGPAPIPVGRTVTSEAPLRVYVAGDSQATYLGLSLHSGRIRALVDVTRADRIATSLARPDYFNWPAEMQKVSETDDPELVVFFLGANDWQGMISGEGALLRRGTDEWRQEWGWRLFLTLEVLKGEHRHVIWVGQPPMRDHPFREGAPVMNEIAREIIAGRDDATMIDIWEMFGGDGEYREQVVGPDGEEFRARQNDGVHLRREASEWVADLVVDVIARRWDLQPG